MCLAGELARRLNETSRISSPTFLPSADEVFPVQACRVELSLGEQTLFLETGKIAKQAHGAVVVGLGDTWTLTAACEGSPIPGRDFFPLVVDYREKTYAAGKFPGGFIKREGRPTTKEILTSRLIDRPIRPLFPSGYINEVQVMAAAMSFDNENDPDVLCMIGSSAALHVSHIPFLKVTGSVRVGRIGSNFVVMPTVTQMEESDLDLIVAGTPRRHHHDRGLLARNVRSRHGQRDSVRPRAHSPHHCSDRGIPRQSRFVGQGISPRPAAQSGQGNHQAQIWRRVPRIETNQGQKESRRRHPRLRERIFDELVPEEGEGDYTPQQVAQAFEWLEESIVRSLILEGKRIDGRGVKDIRPISCEVGVLPRVHGSALFTRGETQALVTTVLGTSEDEQRVDGLHEEYSKKFMLDYNFPPFSVGECKPIRGPGRREIGHGALAERSLKPVIPGGDKFPYTIRLVSDILESNGSSSMASVCGGTLALMDAGVPISDPVAGISIGLVKETDRFTLLTDIMGDEDHFGDMDFKVAGTIRGITGIQLDLKIDGINAEIIRATLDQAREARREILKAIVMTLRFPRGETSRFAPRMLRVKINPEKIGLLIGPGGKTIRGIQEQTGAKLDIQEDGTVEIAHASAEGAEQAKLIVESLCEDVKIGKIYEGRVTSVKDFGAFIEILPGRDGLCHISELDDKFVDRVDTVCKVGDMMKVKVIAIDDQDRVKLSRKAVLREQRGGAPAPAPAGQPPRPQGGDSRRD